MMTSAFDSQKPYDPAILFRFQNSQTLPDLPLDKTKLLEASAVAQDLLLLDPSIYLQAVLGELYNNELAQEFRDLVAKGASLHELIARAESISTASASQITASASQIT